MEPGETHREKKEEEEKKKKKEKDEERKDGEVQKVPTDKRRIECENFLADPRRAISAAVEKLFTEALYSTAEVANLRYELEGLVGENAQLWRMLDSTKADLESTKDALEKAELRLQAACNAQCGDVGTEGVRKIEPSVVASEDIAHTGIEEDKSRDP
jgi:hypothetical protein